MEVSHETPLGSFFSEAFSRTHVTVIKQVQSIMTPSGDESKALDDFLRVDTGKDMDYESETDLMEEEETKPITPTCDEKSRREPNPFPDLVLWIL